MKNLMLIISFVSVCLFSSVTHAEKIFYESIGEYYMSEFETAKIANLRAKNNALQNIAEEFGAFLKSQSWMKNSNFIDDEIVVVACSIIHVLEVHYESSPTPDGKFTIHRAKVKAVIDSEEFEKIMSMTPQDYQLLIIQIKTLQQKIDKQNNRLSELKNEIARVNSEKDNAKIRAEYSEAEKEILLVEKFSEGYKFYLAENYAAALEHFNQAVQLKTDDPNIYSVRGAVYMRLGEYQKALNDFDETIRRNSNTQNEFKGSISYTYCMRGSIYLLSDLYLYAIEDFSKALATNLDNNTKYASAIYTLRSIAYSQINKYHESISDAHKALQINPDSYEVYHYLAIGYMGIQDFDKALYNAKKSVEIEPDSSNYATLSTVYRFLGNIESALEYIDRAINLSPNEATLYEIRSEIYKALGNISAAQADL